MSNLITIYSVFADSPEHRIAAHYEGRNVEPIWTGEVDVRDLEDIFRLFNRVDADDALRLEELGYHLPSLSVGDVVSYGGTYKIVADQGFEDIVEGEYHFIRQSPDHHRAASLVLEAIRRERDYEARKANIKAIRKGLARWGTHHYYRALRLQGREV